MRVRQQRRSLLDVSYLLFFVPIVTQVPVAWAQPEHCPSSGADLVLAPGDALNLVDREILLRAGRIYEPSQRHDRKIERYDLEVQLVFHDAASASAGENLPAAHDFFYNLSFRGCSDPDRPVRLDPSCGWAMTSDSA
ncbi:MAG: hypothetical protein JSV80_03860 [Acidobacteriota bacterium]|nr:MAG: hypothetical protein JSV80_03860 [Acidobacteriota bacterium]